MNPGLDSKILLEPITADSPCGEDLEDTPLLASFDGFRIFGQSTPLDPAPDWAEVKKRALEALAKSKDLRLLAHLGSAVLRTDGVSAFTDTLNVASQWLSTWWTQTYPLITEDVVLRRNALNCFADQVAVLDGLRRAPLVASRQHGTFTLRDIDIATGQLQPREGEQRPDEAQINSAFAGMPLEELQALQQSTAEGLGALKTMAVTMGEAAGSEAAPSFEGLSAHLARIDRFLRTQLNLRQGIADEATDRGAVPGTEPSGRAVPAGSIASRQDAVRALEAVAEFFRRNEPSSPIPLIVERAKRLVSKDFLEVLADVAPDALAQARAAGGLRQAE